MEKATFAAGCFWGIEAAFRKLPGIIKTTVGYTGGTLENPTYEQVCSHTSGHAEAVLIEYDPSLISYDELLQTFWQIHDSTSLNRQGPDIGSQYRSAIFYNNAQQKSAAEKSKKELGQKNTFLRPIVTEITAAGVFYPAEDYHQQYFDKRGIRHC